LHSLRTKTIKEDISMKTKLGITANLLGAGLYFIGLVGGWVPVILLAGYVLLFESNDWLKNAAIKAVAICVFFAIVSAIVGLIPNAITLVDNVFSIFKGNFSIAFVSKIVTLANTILTIAQKLLLLVLGFKGLHFGTIGFGVVDRLIAKHTPKDN
jgi:hypothetical protein